MSCHLMLLQLIISTFKTAFFVSSVSFFLCDAAPVAKLSVDTNFLNRTYTNRKFWNVQQSIEAGIGVQRIFCTENSNWLCVGISWCSEAIYHREVLEDTSERRDLLCCYCSDEVENSFCGLIEQAGSIFLHKRRKKEEGKNRGLAS